jgi:hypothetical protein
MKDMLAGSIENQDIIYRLGKVVVVNVREAGVLKGWIAG